MNPSQVIIAPIFPLWVIAILLILGSIFTFFQFRLIMKRLSLTRSLSLFLLRLAALSLLILFALNPTWTVRKEAKVSPTLAILLDNSPGMGMPGREGKGNRLDEARALLLDGSRPLLKYLSERFDVRLYELGEFPKALNPKDLATLKVGEKKGDLGAGIAQLSGKASLALLVSDGSLEWGEGRSADFPIFTLPVGQPEKYKDILIKAVKAPAMAFRGREVEIDVRVKSYGYDGLKVPVVLKDGEKLLKAKDVRLDEKTGEGTVSLSFTPEEVGSQNLSVLVPRQLGESLTANNTVRLPLKVVRDKIRILMITGSPSMSYRYMRMALKNDPSIDLLSFVILRLPSNILNVPLEEQSLIPFPVETLFTKELKDFDLLIFDDFQSSLFFKAQYLENVRDFVKKGGAFAIIGGPAFTGEGGYAGTAIEEILPVRWAGKEGYRRNSPLGVKLSRAGRVHPLTRLSPLEGEDLNLWQEMSPLDGVNPLRPKSSGTVLLESTEGNSWPILTVGSYGKGRVLVLATDDSWKWYMGMVAQGKGNWAYLRLMERMVRWLTKDPSLEPVRMSLPEVLGTTGQETELRVWVQEEPAFSKAGMAISASVINPEGSKISSQIKPVGQTGEYLLSFLPEKEGAYKVKVETRGGSWEESIVIGGRAENLDGFPNHELLKKISASSRGKTLTGGDDFLKELKSYEEGAHNRFIEESRHPLWGNAYILVLLLTLLTMEWYFRRRWGLI